MLRKYIPNEVDGAEGDVAESAGADERVEALHAPPRSSSKSRLRWIGLAAHDR